MNNISKDIVYSEDFTKGMYTGRMNIIRELYGNFINCNPSSIVQDFFKEFRYLTFTNKEVEEIENFFSIKNNNTECDKEDYNTKSKLLKELLDNINSKFKYTINFIKYRDVEYNIDFYHTHISTLIMAFCDYIKYYLVKDLEDEDCINLYNYLPIQAIDILQYAKDKKLNIIDEEYINIMLDYCINLNIYGVVEENKYVSYSTMMYLRELSIKMLDNL